jgi:hypothetical protein
MINLNLNEYIDLYDPVKNYYLSVRIIEIEDEGYKCKALSNNKEFKITDYHLKNYGFRRNWISENILNELGFKKNGLLYKLEDIIVWECLIGKLENIEHPYYIYEYSSKHLGYAIFEEHNLIAFQKDFKIVDYNSDNKELIDKYLITSSINVLFEKLIKRNSDKYSYEEFDKIIIK